MIALNELRNLPLHEKLRMMEALWEGISPEEADLAVPQWHKDLLEDRENLIREGKAAFVEWESAKQQILNSIR